MKINKKALIIGGLIILAVIILFVSIYNSKKVVVHFKNPKTIEINNKKGNISVTYDDNGKIKYEKESEDKLENKESNYKLKFLVSDYKIDGAKKIKQNVQTNKNLKVEDIKIGDYDGFAITNLKTADTTVYIFVNKEDVVLKAKIYSVDYEKVQKQLKAGAKAEDIIYNLDEVQQILQTIKYKK